jgi:hypothetical protein
MEGLKMKTYILLAALSILILAGCTSTKSTTDYDDVYATSKKGSEKATKNPEIQTTSPDYYKESSDNSSEYFVEDYEAGENVTYNDEPYLTTTETVTTPEGTNYITNNYYEGYAPDDYNDYSYASQIDRFYGSNMGYSYYAPCYTGYYYNPWYWDSYWYMPSFYFGFGWGGMYWGYPYYPYYYPYNDYWYGYNQGYWDGYYGYGYNDYSGYYYGHRENRGGSGNSGSQVSKDNSSAIQNVTQPNYFERTTPQLAENFTSGRNSNNTNEGGGRNSTNAINNQNAIIAIPQSNNPTTGRNSDQNISGSSQEPIGRSSTNTTGGTGIIPGEKNNSQNVTQDQSRVANSSSRYTYKKPAVNSNDTKGGYKPGQSIEVNNNSRPAQKYNKPANGSSSGENVGNSQQGSTTGNRNTQTYTRPQSNYNNSYSKPAQNNSNIERNSQPERSSSGSYSQPSRSSSNSQPSRSSNSYSQPSRSSSSKSYSSPSNTGGSRSYSTPSRSSSSGSYSAPSRSSSGSGSSSRSSSGSGSSSGGSSRGGRK